MTDTDMDTALRMGAIILAQQAEILRLRNRVHVLEGAYQMAVAAYTRQTQLALAAGLVRFVMTGDRP